MAGIVQPRSAPLAGLELSYQLAGLPTRGDYLRAAGVVLSRLLSCDFVVWSAVDVSTSAVEVVPYNGRGWEAQRLEDRLASVLDDHPLVLSYLGVGRARESSPRRLSDVSTRSQVRATRAYAELLHPLGIEHQLAILSGRVSPSSARGWVVNRSSCNFSDDELDLARAIQPALCLLDITGGTQDVLSDAQQAAAAPLGLSSREVEVLRCLSAGLTVEAIGRQLRISSRTVRKHLENAYRKLDCHDRLMAVTAARRAGVVV